MQKNLFECKHTSRVFGFNTQFQMFIYYMYSEVVSFQFIISQDESKQCSQTVLSAIE